MRALTLIFAVLLTLPNLAFGQERNDFWIVWERGLPPLPDCKGEECTQSMYFGHYIDGMDGSQAQSFFQGLGQFASEPRNAGIRMARSPLCLGPQPEAIPDVTTLKKAPKIELLRGLEGVHVDLRGVRGPQSFRGSFGEEAQEFLEAAFAQHNIPILSKEDAAATRANATLSMRFSAEVFGCRPWSVSLSLSQRMLLAHDVNLLLEGSTWSSSARQDETNADFSASQAMEQVILAFVNAWREVNDPNWVAPEETN